MNSRSKPPDQVRNPDERTRIETVAHNFKPHDLSPDQSDRALQIRAEFERLAIFIIRLTPESAEQAIAISELDSALSWAEKAIARHPGSA